MALIVNGVAPGATVSAADIDDATAVGEALMTAANEAAGRTAIGAAATVTTTRGDLIRRGASADERVPLGAAPAWLRSDGTDALWSVSADCDGDSPAWTDTAGGGTAAFTGGVATFTSPSGVSVARADGARSTVALSALGLADPWRLRIEARLQTYDASGVRRAGMGVSSKASLADADYAAGDFGAFVFVLNAGELVIYDFVGATFTARQVSAITLALDGEDWLALEMRGPYLTLLHGRGSTRPTSWAIAATAVWAGGPGGTQAVPPAYALLGGYRSDTTASVFTAAWSGVRVMDLP